MTYEDRLSEFMTLVNKIEYLRSTINGLAFWDKITYMPPKGIEHRSKVMSFLTDEQYKILSSAEFKNHLAYFEENPQKSVFINSLVRKIKRSSENFNKIPEDNYLKYIELIAISEQVWEQAKQENDFEVFRDYLEKIFNTFRSFAEAWGYEENPYDALMNYYEEGLTVSLVDSLAVQLKDFLIPFGKKVVQAQAIQSADSTCKPFRIGPISKEKQNKIWVKILKDLGFDFRCGRIDIGSHPTILSMSPNDVRIVSNMKEDDPLSGIFNILHAGGKGIYQQSISSKLAGTCLCEAPSFAMEEAVGRLYENILGRSLGFCKYLKANFSEEIPELNDYTAEEIFRHFNCGKPSLIRIEADELTYLMHIIIRYEIEKEIINGQIDVEELPAVWDEKYKQYLGILPKGYSDGVLQDIHWASGYVGYFPAYFIANLAAVQISSAMEKEVGSLDDLVAQGNYYPIKNWLKKNVFQFGSLYTTKELLKLSTGDDIDAEPFIDYLREKYSEVYKLTNLKEKKNE